MRAPGWVCLYGGGNPARVTRSPRYALMPKAVNVKGLEPLANRTPTRLPLSSLCSTMA
jgi:hypothetical protein